MAILERIKRRAALVWCPKAGQERYPDNPTKSVRVHVSSVCADCTFFRGVTRDGGHVKCAFPEQPRGAASPNYRRAIEALPQTVK